MPLALIVFLVGVALVGLLLAGHGATRVFGVLLALFAGHYAIYDSLLRGCYDELCDRFYYLFPLLVVHVALLLVIGGITIWRWRRGRRGGPARSGR
jgi:hypothetical protein